MSSINRLITTDQSGWKMTASTKKHPTKCLFCKCYADYGYIEDTPQFCKIHWNQESLLNWKQDTYTLQNTHYEDTTLIDLKLLTSY